MINHKNPGLQKTLKIYRYSLVTDLILLIGISLIIINFDVPFKIYYFSLYFFFLTEGLSNLKKNATKDFIFDDDNFIVNGRIYPYSKLLRVIERKDQIVILVYEKWLPRYHILLTNEDQIRNKLFNLIAAKIILEVPVSKRRTIITSWILFIASFVLSAVFMFLSYKKGPMQTSYKLAFFVAMFVYVVSFFISLYFTLKHSKKIIPLNK